jgi:Tol biopolymer transport system component
MANRGSSIRAAAALACLFFLVLGGSAGPLVERGGDNESLNPSISADGRYVAFQSAATNLIADDRNPSWDIFARDRQAGATELISVSTAGIQGNGESTQPSISADGRFVAFSSYADNLVANDRNQQWDVFVRNRQARTTELISVSSSGEQANHRSESPSPESISADGRYVVFQSDATNLARGKMPVRWEIYMRDRVRHTTELVSLSSQGEPADRNCRWPSISGDGRYVTFQSSATNLVSEKAAYNWEFYNVYVRDRQSGKTELISASASGVPGDHNSTNATLSADGRYVAFLSTAVNLVKGEEGRQPDLLRAALGGENPATRYVPTMRKPDVFLRDRQTGETRIVSVSNAGERANHRTFTPFVSADGRSVVFESTAGNLVPAAEGTAPRIASDIYLRSAEKQLTERVSIFPAGPNVPLYSSANPVLSADGRYVAFHAVIYPQGTRHFSNVFVRDMQTDAIEMISVAASPPASP